ncbi:hypothetical protein BD779DRAFT_1685253 [Infundibulicybe gibba]|nr:hypothetical protein BD779DRAFT_1685253 [Infundibulicybe gibba]
MVPPLQRFSLFEFCQRAQELLAPEHDRAEFIKFVLCGICNGGQVVIDPYQDVLQDHHPIQVTRDYDSLLGFEKDIIVETDMTVTPVSRHADTLTKSIHLNIEIPDPSDPGKFFTVPAHRVPNVDIGKWEGRNSVRAFFPLLWSRNRSSPILSQEEHTVFYEMGLKPAIDFLEQETGLASEWPPKYTDELFRARTTKGQLVFQTKVLRKKSVRRLGSVLRKSFKFNKVRWASGMIFMHQVQGVKAATMYNPDDYNHEDGLPDPILRAFLERNHISWNRMRHGKWFIDVAIEVKSMIKESLQWRSDSHSRLSGAALQLTDEQAVSVTALGSHHYVRDVVSHLPAVAGCRIDPGAHTYAKEAGRSAKFMTCKQALALRPGKSSRFCDGLYELYTNASQGHPSNARFEVRVPHQFAEKVLQNFDKGVLQSSLFAFDTVVWWSIRSYRVLAIKYVLMAQANSSARSRSFYGSLLLTAGCVWLANSLHCRPDDQNASRDLMGCLFPHTARAGADKNTLAYPRGSLEDVSGGSDDEDRPQTLPYHPYGMFFLVKFTHERGHSPRLDMQHIDRLPIKSFLFFFGVKFADVGLYYFHNGPRGVNTARVTNKAKVTPRFYHNEPEALPDVFNIAALGTVGNPTPIDDGLDLEESDIPEPEGTLDNALSMIWRQFFVDLVVKSPNQRGAKNPSYLKMPLEDRLTATDAIFKSKDLAKYWVIFSWRMAESKEWDRAFDHLWPPKNYQPVGNTQNYKNCIYYKKWADLLTRLTDADAKKIRKEVRVKMNELMWWPNAQQDRIWCTRTDDRYTIADSGAPQDRPAPQLLVRF